MNLSSTPIRFRPTAPLENLRRRASLYRSLRAFFDAQDFIEVSTPTLSRDVVVDRFVESVPVKLDRCWQERDELANARFPSKELAKENATTFYLQTSPEFAMKRLVAAGMKAIYQLAPAYRRGDRGEMHNLEFTMLEWYRQGDDYQAGRNLLASLILEVAKDFYARVGLEPLKRFQRVEERAFGDVFQEYTGFDPHDATCADLRAFADARNIAYPDSYADPNGAANKDDWLDLIFSDAVQPNLGKDAVVILYDYPASQSQLANAGEVVDTRTGKTRVVSRRFELFANGVELANGYDELLDPSVLRDRIAVTAEERRRDGSPELPHESRLLAAMDAGLPKCSGCALGVDRFFMVLLDAQKIDDVIAFPIELA